MKSVRQYIPMQDIYNRETDSDPRDKTRRYRTMRTSTKLEGVPLKSEDSLRESYEALNGAPRL